MKGRWWVIGAALVLLSAPGLVTAQSPLSAPAGDPEAGARLFRTRGCVECHAADLARFQRQPRPLFELAAAMWNHFPRMAEQIRASTLKRPYLASTEMRDLATFLYPTDPADPARTRLLGEPGDPERGRRLVADKGCLVCHSITAPGGPRAGSLDDLKGWDSAWSVVAQMWNHAFLMQLETEGQRAGWQQLSAGEMADLVAFLQALMRAR
jgi:mono/diheme cytochrome c family protein